MKGGGEGVKGGCASFDTHTKKLSTPREVLLHKLPQETFT